MLKHGESQVDTDNLFVNAIHAALIEGFKQQLSSHYSNPLNELVKSAISRHQASIGKIIDDSIAACINAEEFRQEIASAVRANLAKLLIQRFGGEVEKQVNALKSDPTTRARITLAIEDIVRQTKS